MLMPRRSSSWRHVGCHQSTLPRVGGTTGIGQSVSTTTTTNTGVSSMATTTSQRIEGEYGFFVDAEDDSHQRRRQKVQSVRDIIEKGHPYHSSSRQQQQQERTCDFEFFVAVSFLMGVWLCQVMLPILLAEGTKKVTTQAIRKRDDQEESPKSCLDDKIATTFTGPEPNKWASVKDPTEGASPNRPMRKTSEPNLEIFAKDDNNGQVGNSTVHSSSLAGAVRDETLTRPPRDSDAGGQDQGNTLGNGEGLQPPPATPSPKGEEPEHAADATPTLPFCPLAQSEANGGSESTHKLQCEESAPCLVGSQEVEESSRVEKGTDIDNSTPATPEAPLLLVPVCTDCPEPPTRKLSDPCLNQGEPCRQSCVDSDDTCIGECLLPPGTRSPKGEEPEHAADTPTKTICPLAQPAANSGNESTHEQQPNKSASCLIAPQEVEEASKGEKDTDVDNSIPVMPETPLLPVCTDCPEPPKRKLSNPCLKDMDQREPRQSCTDRDDDGDKFLARPNRRDSLSERGMEPAPDLGQMVGMEEEEDTSQADSVCSSDTGSLHESTGGSASRRCTVPSTSAGNGYHAGDYYEDATVLYAQILGLTAWSSSRPAAQIFDLLHDLSKKFEDAASDLGVKLVKTVTDSYVAVSGVPVAQADHAVRMVLYSRRILQEMVTSVQSLERKLGPGTASLRLKVGISSGPVVAGFVQDPNPEIKLRLCNLLGPTVNVATELNTTSVRHRIHVSSATAELLVKAGKRKWIKKREPLNTTTKSDGDEMDTYWVVFPSLRRNFVKQPQLDSDVLFPRASSEEASVAATDCSPVCPERRNVLGDVENNFIFAVSPISRSANKKRLVDWVLKLLLEQLNRVVEANRRIQKCDEMQSNNLIRRDNAFLENFSDGKVRPLEEVVDAVHLKRQSTVEDDCSFLSGSSPTNAAKVDVASKVGQQLEAMVVRIASHFRDDLPYHNFEKAAYTAMSVQKLLIRCMVSDDSAKIDSLDVGSSHNSQNSVQLYMADIDPLSQFAIFFAALISDIAECGKSNRQLAEEKPHVCEMYGGESVKEQMSTNTGWDILMDPCYKDLQECLFSTEEDLFRFRCLVCNCVLATDHFNGKAQAWRNRRWDKAFHVYCDNLRLHEGDLDLKATVVIEALVQASDISNTLQHWDVYLDWQERLFREKNLAFDAGVCTGSNPVETWYEDELAFLGKHAVPLAKRLAEAKVFGASSSECLNHALNNQKRWSNQGKQLVKDMYDRYCKRREMEIGGFTNNEINTLTVEELSFIMKKLIKKGQNTGTNAVGQNDAAQAWLDALEIYERCPASAEMEDKEILFPIYSGIFAWIRGGKVQQDSQGHFEVNLAQKFVKESMCHPDPIHYMRALSMFAEICGRRGKCTAALAIFKKLAEVYDAESHSSRMAEVYGTDRAAQTFSFSAMWHHHLGNVGQAIEACNYVIQDLMPTQDPTNTLGNWGLLINVMRVLKPQGQALRMREVLDEYVVEAHLKHHGPKKFTPCKSLFKPTKWLLDICHDPSDFVALDEAVDWMIDGDNGNPHDFLDNIHANIGWAASDLAAELCLRLVTQLRTEGKRDQATQRALIKKGLFLARKADMKLKSKEGVVILPLAIDMHTDVFEQLEALAKDEGILQDVPFPPHKGPGLEVRLPPSYLRTPDIPL
ncbi:natriuretic peptide receptor 2 [Seminavis robusta]|uniref:Natriuretic peptide receptor 2 n=1 Tax=Seminavis robusta TaxID=568900 RepID=A0A9N8HHF3_9STRA|nr:natriuretic peptide receptor 2 [Seminavis robusta]|eukprot:Sro534_g161800.1 natriuretic peptide receptor 2 (1651) ;mRNA; r:37939-43295